MPMHIGLFASMFSLTMGIDYLEAGDSLHEFLQDFPSVTRKQAVAALELAKQMLAAQSIDVLLTVDQSVRHQQNFHTAAVVVLIAASNRLADLVPSMPTVLAALGSIKPGDIIEVTA